MKLQTELLRTPAFIDGKWQNARRRTHPGRRESRDGEKIGTIPDMGAAETRRAIEAAQAAFPAWAAQARPRSVQRILRRWYELLMANQEDLATLMTAEQGKPLAEAKGEIAYAASFIEWFAEEGKAPLRRRDPRAPGGQAHPRACAQPVGVVACDHAVELPARDDHAQGRAGARRRLHVRRASPPPRPRTRRSRSRELAERAGFPAGVLNIVTGRAARSAAR